MIYKILIKIPAVLYMYMSAISGIIDSIDNILQAMNNVNKSHLI